MNPETTAELRAALARASGINQVDVADAMGYKPSRLSKILNDQRPMPDGFRDSFLMALRRLVNAEAGRLRSEAEEKVKQLLSSVSEPAEAA